MQPQVESVTTIIGADGWVSFDHPTLGRSSECLVAVAPAPLCEDSHKTPERPFLPPSLAVALGGLLFGAFLSLCLHC